MICITDQKLRPTMVNKYLSSNIFTGVFIETKTETMEDSYGCIPRVEVADFLSLFLDSLGRTLPSIYFRDVRPRGLASASRPKNLASASASASASWVVASASASWVVASASWVLASSLEASRGQQPKRNGK